MSKYRVVENTRTDIEKERKKEKKIATAKETKIMDDNKYKERETTPARDFKTGLR